jgi:hypothetical protein
MNSRLGHLFRDSGLILFEGLGITDADALELLLLEPGLQDFPSVKRDLYLPYSRADGIDQVCSLIEASDAFQFIWLHGGAGGGKPTLVYYLKSLFQDSGCLAAYIVFNRQATENTSFKDVVHAIARQNTFNHPSSTATVNDALRNPIPGSEHGMLLQNFILLLLHPSTIIPPK